MDIASVMDDMLRSGPNAVAIACADVRAGFVLGAAGRGESEREAATDAALCAGQVCSIPSLEADNVVDGASALVVSAQWVHAYARVSRRPELVVVGVANANANVALLLDWVKRVAGGLEAVA